MIVPIHLIHSNDIQYNITIGALPLMEFDNKVAVITNETIAPLHLDTLLEHINAPQISVVTIKDGEEYKNLATIESILNQLFEKRLDRKSTLIAFGGGVIGDMTGFCASLYQRGIKFVQIPTTLLAQVDASVGGKTGVNNAYGKNLIGAFYQPAAVYIDPKFLETLPPREFGAGVAEMIKMAVMFDKEFYNYIRDEDIKEPDVLKECIKRSVELKAEVVNQDEKEAGIRAVLNYGHTFAHVIENETCYTTYLHGEAVAIGMVMANELAVELGLLSVAEGVEIEALLARFDLPTSYKIEDVNSFYEHFFLDKKSANNSIKFILPNGSIGTHSIKSDIDENIVKKVLERFV
ncbi:MAG: 3-dehydroquinate synthase [Campylobacterales bacterium]|nr:3-dehydroquinate synthase [Campylobacterales bacterium]